MSEHHDTLLQRRRQIGGRVRELRLGRDRSQAVIARTAGITQASLSNYETGKREMPLATALGVAAALDVGLGELLDVPELIVMRDSRHGRAVALLVERPELADRLFAIANGHAAEAAS